MLTRLNIKLITGLLFISVCASSSAVHYNPDGLIVEQVVYPDGYTPEVNIYWTVEGQVDHVEYVVSGGDIFKEYYYPGPDHEGVVMQSMDLDSARSTIKYVHGSKVFLFHKDKKLLKLEQYHPNGILAALTEYKDQAKIRQSVDRDGDGSFDEVIYF